MEHVQQTSHDPLANAARYRATDPETSREAAEQVKVGKLENRVLGAIRSLGSATSEEVADFLKIDRVTVSPRFRPLERKGLIRETSERRRGHSGKTSVVWAPA